MTGIEIAMVVVGILGFIVLVLRIKYRDPFSSCDYRKVYVDE
jgi:hypothetical protein